MAKPKVYTLRLTDRERAVLHDVVVATIRDDLELSSESHRALGRVRSKLVHTIGDE